MKQRLKQLDILSIITIFILAIVSIVGVLSLDFSKSYEVVNQYGSTIKMYGSGVYAHDTYFKAPISIGTDFTIILVVIPMFFWAFIKNRKNHSIKTEISLLSIYSVALYYALNISFGLSYNRLHLLYIALFSCTLFGIFSLLRIIKTNTLSFEVTRGVSIFLIMSGVALIAAWMPDIIPTIFTGESLALIEVYTIEVTYVLDMGIIGPLCLVCLYLLKKRDGLGTLLLAIILKLCIIVGIMMIPQTICQIMSGYDLPLPVLITKSGSFVLLGAFALYFNHKLYNKVQN